MLGYKAFHLSICLFSRISDKMECLALRENMNHVPNVLMLEDDEETVMVVSRLLEKHCQVNVCRTIQNAKQALANGFYDLILLDLELPDGGGMGFYAEMRQDDLHGRTPTIFLTGNSALDQKIKAFGLGADDYITKPFVPGELKARILAKLAKSKSQTEGDQIISVRNLAVNLSTQRVTLSSNGKTRSLDVSQIELRLLTLFMKQIDRVFSREQLIEQVWGNTVHISMRTLDSHVSHLRSKLRESSCLIESVRGVGYRMTTVEST